MELKRELKFATEKYFKGKLTVAALYKTAAELRKQHWLLQRDEGITLIPVNVIPKRYQVLGLSELDTYFAMARGYQDQQGDVRKNRAGPSSIRREIQACVRLIWQLVAVPIRFKKRKSCYDIISDMLILK